MNLWHAESGWLFDYLQCSAEQYSVQYSSGQYSVAECRTVQYSVIQCSTVQYSGGWMDVYSLKPIS